MEVLKDDSSGSFADANLPSSISSVTDDWYKLKSFQENISFNLQEDNNFLVTHSLSFGVDNVDTSFFVNVAPIALKKVKLQTMAVDGAWGREAVNKYSWYGPFASFTTGMFAAQVAAVFTNPIDVVKVRTTW